MHWNGEERRLTEPRLNQELEDMMERVASRSADAAVKKVLINIGLDPEDKNTGKDVAELRGSIAAYRAIKNTVFKEFIRVGSQALGFVVLTWILIKLGLYDLLKQIRLMWG